MDENILAILRRENPWLERPRTWGAAVAARLPPVFVARAQPKLGSLIEDGGTRRKALLVVGPRQAGKSTWIWKELAEIEARPLVINCEIPRLREWCSDPGALLADLPGIVSQPTVLLVDEVQHLEEAGLFIKGLVDRGLPCPLIVTGSASFHLRSKTRESLAGRARRIRLLPLSLAEVSEDLVGQAPVLGRELRKERLMRHTVVGGYPAVWQAVRPEEELAALVEAFVLRDASDLYRVQRPDAFRTLMALAARQVGSAVNLSEWASIAGVSVPTVSSYLEMMEESHLVVRVPSHAGGKRAELTASPKLYFVDNGLRNRLAGGFSPLGERPDDGAVLENWVFTEVYKALPLGATIAWWRTKSGAEVDLVVREGEHLVAIEVKALRGGRPALGRGARSFIEAYAPERFYVVTLGAEHEETVGSCRIEWIHAVDLVDRLLSVVGAS